MKEGYMTQTEVLNYLGMHQNTFKSYAHRMGIEGQQDGRRTMYKRSDIERINKALAGRVPFLIQKLEELTGCEVTLTSRQ